MYDAFEHVTEYMLSTKGKTILRDILERKTRLLVDITNETDPSSVFDLVEEILALSYEVVCCHHPDEQCNCWIEMGEYVILKYSLLTDNHVRDCVLYVWGTEINRLGLREEIRRDLKALRMSTDPRDMWLLSRVEDDLVKAQGMYE